MVFFHSAREMDQRLDIDFLRRSPRFYCCQICMLISNGYEVMDVFENRQLNSCSLCTTKTEFDNEQG